MATLAYLELCFKLSHTSFIKCVSVCVCVRGVCVCPPLYLLVHLWLDQLSTKKSAIFQCEISKRLSRNRVQWYWLELWPLWCSSRSNVRCGSVYCFWTPRDDQNHAVPSQLGPGKNNRVHISEVICYKYKNKAKNEKHIYNSNILTATIIWKNTTVYQYSTK